MTGTTGATCTTCTTVLPAAGTPCARCTSAPSGGAAGGPQYAPYQGMPYPGTPYPGTPYPVAPYQPTPYAARAPKSAGIAILLTFLWIGAGHLYLDRMGTGFALMAGHFFLGVFLFFLFFPLGFVAWLAAVICCAIWCSNLTGQINAGTVPQRETW